MRVDLPGVSPFVFHHATRVAVGHDRRRFECPRTGVEGASIRSVGIVDIDVEKGGHPTASSRVADHDDRVADLDLGWTVLPVFSDSAEHLLDELDELPGLGNHDSWSHGVPALWGKRKTVECLLHLEFSLLKERFLRPPAASGAARVSCGATGLGQ